MRKGKLRAIVEGPNKNTAVGRAVWPCNLRRFDLACTWRAGGDFWFLQLPKVLFV